MYQRSRSRANEWHTIRLEYHPLDTPTSTRRIAYLGHGRSTSGACVPGRFEVHAPHGRRRRVDDAVRFAAARVARTRWPCHRNGRHGAAGRTGRCNRHLRMVDGHRHVLQLRLVFDDVMQRRSCVDECRTYKHWSELWVRT